MKKVALTLALLFTMTIVFTSCRDEKSADEKIEEAIHEMGDDMHHASDDVKDAMEDVQHEIKEAKEEGN